MKPIFYLACISLSQHVISFESKEFEVKINNFLKWKMYRPNVEVGRCFSVSYGFENEMDFEIPMLEINIDKDFAEIDRNLLASTDHCFLAFMSIEHRSRLPELITKLNNISTIIQVKPTAIFVIGDEINNKITWAQQTILTVS